jgi:hypothetical protein
VASRKEQKERLRREREEREQRAREAERRRKRLMGYGVGGALAAAVVVVLFVLLAAGGDGGDGAEAKGTSLPDGGKLAQPRITDLPKAAAAANCELKDFPAKSREHTTDPAKKVAYDSNPPTAGKHYQFPANDGAYTKAPPVTALVHALEHGRVVIWFRPGIPTDVRAQLKALFDEDSSQLILTPNTTRMPYQVAASAWSADPQPLGEGRLLGCPTFGARTIDALRAFENENKGNGPEAVP